MNGRAATLARWLALATLLLAQQASAAGFASAIDTDPGSGISMRMTATFDNVPRQGFAPVRIFIRNHDGRDHSWTFHVYSSSSYNGRSRITGVHSFGVEAGAERTFEVLVPLAPSIEDYSSPQLSIRATGYGVTGRSLFEQSSSSSYGSLGKSPFVALSETAGLENWTLLETAFRDAGFAFLGARFEPGSAPEEGLGWSGCDVVLLGSADWIGMAPVQQQALLNWVKVGGHLFVLQEAGEAAPTAMPPPGPPGKPAALGLGRLESWPWHQARIDVPLLHARLIKDPLVLSETLSKGYPDSWPLRDGLGKIAVRRGLLLGFVFAFAFLVGPINLFVAARRQRHRQLFWTTPALSLAASLALAVLIILQDGFSGQGHRTAVVYLDPAAHQNHVVQESALRTGVLLRRNVPADPALLLLPLNLDRAYQRRSFVCTRDNTGLGGDWFTSRAIQGHLAVATIPGRARLEILPGPTPAVLSSLESDLDEVFYRDGAGAFWHTAALRPGEKRDLEPADLTTFGRWWMRACASQGGRLKALTAPLQPQPGFVYASSGDADAQLWSGLPDLVWNRTQVLYFGPAATPAGEVTP